MRLAPLIILASFSCLLAIGLTTTRAEGIRLQLCLVVDGSGSISAAEWNLIKEAVAKAVNETIPRDGSVEMAIVQFGYPSQDGYAKTEIPPTAITSANYANVSKHVLAMPKGGGQTPIAHGLQLGWSVLIESPNFAAASRQVINLATDELPNIRNNNATADLDGDGGISARDDVLTVVNAAAGQGLDELDVEVIGMTQSSREWFRTWAVHPKPGVLAPPFTKPGWVRPVADPAELAATVGQKLREILSEGGEIWVPSLEGALAASLITVTTTGVLASLASSAGGPEGQVGAGLAGKANEALPDFLKQWLQDFVSSKRKLVIDQRTGPRLIPTRLELISFGVSFAALTLSFSYSDAGSLEGMLAVIPVVLATSVLVEFTKTLAMQLAARLQGVWCEYRVWPFGLATFTLTTLLFRAPFSSPSRLCHHAPRFTSRSQGVVALVGVLVAFGFAGAFYYLIAVGFAELGNIGLVMCLIMALFDCIPIPPMNGKDIYDWSRTLWITLFTATFTVYLLCLLTL